MENHELHEKNRQLEAELTTLQANFEQYRKKTESEKNALLRRLASTSESLEAALTDKKEMKAKMGRSEKDIDNMQLNIAELMKCNVMLSEELRDLRKPASAPSTPNTSSTSSPVTSRDPAASNSAPNSPIFSPRSLSLAK